MYKRPKLDVNAIRCLIAMDANKKFPEQKGTPALKALIEEDLKKSIRYFYGLQCKRKLYDKYKSEWFAQTQAKEMIEYLPEELYPNIEEWLDDREISEIPYGDLSIKRIMHWHKTKEGPITHSFPRSAAAMCIYVKNGCQDIDDALREFWIY